MVQKAGLSFNLCAGRPNTMKMLEQKAMSSGICSKCFCVTREVSLSSEDLFVIFAFWGLANHDFQGWFPMKTP